jgi:hypothetical protein
MMCGGGPLRQKRRVAGLRPQTTRFQEQTAVQAIGVAAVEASQEQVTGIGPYPTLPFRAMTGVPLSRAVAAAASHPQFVFVFAVAVAAPLTSSVGSITAAAKTSLQFVSVFSPGGEQVTDPLSLTRPEP